MNELEQALKDGFKMISGKSPAWDIAQQWRIDGRMAEIEAARRQFCYCLNQPTTNMEWPCWTCAVCLGPFGINRPPVLGSRHAAAPRGLRLHGAEVPHR